MIAMTEKAAKEVKGLMAREKLEGYSLRVRVGGGCCSGLSYSLAFEKETGEGDRVFENHGVKIIVDPKSYPHLEGTTVDYTEGVDGSGFTFSNPNAQEGCGCGSPS